MSVWSTLPRKDRPLSFRRSACHSVFPRKIRLNKARLLGITLGISQKWLTKKFSLSFQDIILQRTEESVKQSCQLNSVQLMRNKAILVIYKEMSTS